jgi:hypothetical protein
VDLQPLVGEGVDVNGIRRVLAVQRAAVGAATGEVEGDANDGNGDKVNLGGCNVAYISQISIHTESSASGE